MEINTALNMLGLNQLPTINNLLEAMHELFIDKQLRQEITEARDVILRKIVETQMAEKRYFVIPPIEHACERCHGTGEIYQFHIKEVSVRCHICGGRGSKRVKCQVCEDGRYIRKMNSGGVIINVQCKKCNGTGLVWVKCSSCLGKGELKKVVLSSEIKSTTFCKSCLGFGFKAPVAPEPPKVEQTPMEIAEKEAERLIKKENEKKSLLNTVIDQEMRDRLMSLVV